MSKGYFYPEDWVDNQPFLTWVSSQDVAHGVMADHAGVSPKWLKGEDSKGDKTPLVPWPVVDAVLTTYSVPLWSVYPKLGPDWDAPAHEVILAWCPGCIDIDPTSPRQGLAGVMVVPNADGTCVWCETQTGGAELQGPLALDTRDFLTLPILYEARVLYIQGYSLSRAAETLLSRTPYKNTKTLAEAFNRRFNRFGWPLRPRAESAAVAKLKHGLCVGGKRDGYWAMRWEAANGHQPQCAAFKRGTKRQCRNQAQAGSRFCRFHDPDTRSDLEAKQLAVLTHYRFETAA